MSVSLAVFDLAGTTVKDNNDVPLVLKQVLEKNEVLISIDDAIEVMGIPKPVAIKQLMLKHYRGADEISSEWIEEIHQEFTSSMILFYEKNAFVQEIEGVSEVFARLRRMHIKVFVDTGFSRKITDVILKRMGWQKNDLIDGSVASDEVFFGRPYPDMIYRAMDMTGVADPRLVAKIGDTVSDLQEGLNAGCGFVIGITSGAHTESELAKHYHTHLIPNIENVVPILMSGELVST